MAPGTDVKFKIEATGVDLKFKWQKDRKTDLSDDEKHYDTATDTLNIVEVEKSDKGRYRCRIKNDLDEKFSKEAVLAISKLIIVVDMYFIFTKSYLLNFFCYVGYKILIPFYTKCMYTFLAFILPHPTHS